MTLDCTNLKPGDKVRLRNGTIAPVAINEGSDATEGMLIGVIHSDYVLYFHCPDGKFHHENVDREFDIVEILTNPEPEMNTTTFPFSWRYRLGTLELSDCARENPECGWAKTSDWKPRPIDKKTLTLRDLREAMRAGENPDHDTLQSAIELLEATL